MKLKCKMLGRGWSIFSDSTADSHLSIMLTWFKLALWVSVVNLAFVYLWSYFHNTTLWEVVLNSNVKNFINEAPRVFIINNEMLYMAEGTGAVAETGRWRLSVNCQEEYCQTCHLHWRSIVPQMLEMYLKKCSVFWKVANQSHTLMHVEYLQATLLLPLKAATSGWHSLGQDDDTLDRTNAFWFWLSLSFCMDPRTFRE